MFFCILNGYLSINQSICTKHRITDKTMRCKIFNKARNRPFGRLILTGRGSKIGYAFAPPTLFACSSLATGVLKPACKLRFKLTPREFAPNLLYPIKKARLKRTFLLAGAVRFELTTFGFGDRRSTN